MFHASETGKNKCLHVFQWEKIYSVTNRIQEQIKFMTQGFTVITKTILFQIISVYFFTSNPYKETQIIFNYPE